MVDYRATELLDKLIKCFTWKPQSNEERNLIVLGDIVHSPTLTYLTDEEIRITSELQTHLSPDDWAQLPNLVTRRRLEVAEESFFKRRQEEERREAEVKARRQEAERAAREERDRIKGETESKARKAVLVTRLKGLFRSDFLSADDAFDSDPDAALLSADEYAELKISFVHDWGARELPKSFLLDDEQAAAVAATRGNVQVVARAGTGKTRTLVARAVFLQKHCGISPRSLLLLAFNRKAADEMKLRLTDVLGRDQDLPHVMTFHALAHALVHPDEEMLFDDVSTDQFGLSRVVQDVIDEHIRSQEYGQRVRELMLAHFRNDWERIVEGRFQLSIDEFLAYRRALSRESLKGDFVKSYGERVIANALLEHSVEYRYERNFRWNGLNYRPDFTIPTSSGGIVIEYFGLAGDPDYDEMSQQKRDFWRQQGDWTFLEFSPRDLTDPEAFVATLLQKLQEGGVSSRRLSEDEIWERIRVRALDRFTETTKSFVSRCRKLDLRAADLELRIAGHRACSNAEKLFLEVALPVYESYLRRLADLNKEDFSGLVWRAVALVRNGQTSFVRDRGRERGDLFGLRFVMIDEFQDFSRVFFDLAAAVCSLNRDVRFFCVGDDWQAINGFAGSDLRFFTSFSEYFQDAVRLYLRSNYRSTKTVVQASNALMIGRGPEAEGSRSERGEVLLCRMDEFTPSEVETEQHNGDEITPAVLRLVWRFLGQGREVVLLSRRNGLPWYVSSGNSASMPAEALTRFVARLQSFLPEDDGKRLTASTTHRYKGLEKSAVIVLDAVERSYPLIHPNWVFQRVFGDSISQIEDEERRLFYVALTRAADSLALVTEKGRLSPYLQDIARSFQVPSLQWAALPPVPSLENERLEVRVFHAFNVMDQLKDLGYHFRVSGDDKYWSRAIPAENFSFDTLLSQPWVKPGVGIQVYSEGGELLHKR
ncbi:MAG: AAA family ATPase [Dehalococcoidia bacterium]|nr:AAA family ATPase [Dehalococcoidia bacterium]